ncbi:MAG: copper resistance protein B [Desulfurivibrionaceae bacterium]|nr:copper resistance protein B [Desulfurivibrionaceae bacterium]
MPALNRCWPSISAMVMVLIVPLWARAQADIPTTADRPSHQESAARHQGGAPPEMAPPPLPAGMSLDEVLNYAASPAPAHFPAPVPDDRLYAFTFFEQLEYRAATDATPDHLGWEAQGWIGADFNKFWWKHEGEAVFEGSDQGETETDLLYSRLITPFWNLQAGAQYANEWNSGNYHDRWSAVAAIQGMAPYLFEIDTSLYISEEADVTLALEAEYDLRITQRVVLQPLVAMGFAAQDIAERDLGTGLTDVNLDLRLRYEIKREFAPYIGIRYQFLVGETENIAEKAGADTEQFLVLGGLRLAF